MVGQINREDGVVKLFDTAPPEHRPSHHVIPLDRTSLEIEGLGVRFRACLEGQNWYGVLDDMMALYREHRDDWPRYLATVGVRRGNRISNPFLPLIRHFARGYRDPMCTKIGRILNHVNGETGDERADDVSLYVRSRGSLKAAYEALPKKATGRPALVCRRPLVISIAGGPTITLPPGTAVRDIKAEFARALADWSNRNPEDFAE